MNYYNDTYENDFLECGSFPDMEKLGVSPMEKLSRNKPKIVYSRNLLKMVRLQCRTIMDYQTSQKWLTVAIYQKWQSLDD